jgi:flavin-dependent dehydrogenase
VHAETAIIGGGLAGCAAAITLAQAGREVVLIERESAPHHKVCGEFLSQEALDLLRLLGLEPAQLGAARLQSVRLAHGNHLTHACLPFGAMSLTRRRLDEELLKLAERSGVNVIRGKRVSSLEASAGAWSVQINDADPLTAAAVFVATGKHDLPGEPRPAGKQSGMVGFKMYYRLSRDQAAAVAGHVELLLYRGGYGGLQPVEGDAVNLCCLVHRDQLQRLGGRWENLLALMQRDCPHLATRLNGATPLLERPLAISSIPYGYVRPAAADGVWRLGDQAAVIPSFTGDGMSIALHSGRLAAEMHLAAAGAAAFQRRLSAELEGQVGLATILSRGLVWQPTRSVLGIAVRLWPRALALVASQTRLRSQIRLA